ncbi:phenylacetate--CoA ligase family protein [Chromobacterium sp. IIBBL 290-4]|uniref:phenylacetate--CoA ligase family protein n=1 Tax=Chromobacterium sp. IIBBL 290-4 TaxID=2953890 RepID=UPI0020B69D28|nr:phenylacetate--CoA ligase family protein [Chromobacterium sp. IIBBL 290-4]UTH75540.1 phenylacetate--CoA ligase family protein [Chromobacterium sp. IIBBL 290-4]
MKLSLIQLVEHARSHSAFYRDLYRELPEQGWRLRDLPVTPAAAYWRGADSLPDWPVLTGPLEDGHVFKTGGSTGDGKLSVFRRAEWRDFVQSFGQGLAHQLRAGDRVANLFFAGDLYTSLLFIHGALSNAPLPVVEYPFTCTVEHAHLADAIRSLNINVLAGVPAQLIRFAQFLRDAGQALHGVETVLYGGESLFGEQLALLGQAFPQARLASVGCASVDAGLIGYAAPDCRNGEHRVFDGDSIVEIIDEDSGEPVEDIDQPGLLVLTNLQRRLMPVIRYPTGDRACWRETEGPNRKFSLLGRAGAGHRIRIGTLSLFPDALAETLQSWPQLLAWQLQIDRQDGRDLLGLQLAANQPLPLDAIRREVLARHADIAARCDSGELAFVVRQSPPGELRTHPRSGKLMRVADLRDYQEA